MPHCKNCDAFVTSQFARVFGNNQDKVFRCTECSNTRGILTDDTADLER